MILITLVGGGCGVFLVKIFFLNNNNFLRMFLFLTYFRYSLIILLIMIIIIIIIIINVLYVCKYVVRYLSDRCVCVCVCV